MYITLNNDPKYTNAFLQFVLRRILVLGLDYINQNASKMEYVNTFLNDMFERTDIQAKYIICLALNNLAYRRINDKIDISIKEGIKTPFSASISLEMVCKMID